MKIIVTTRFRRSFSRLVAKNELLKQTFHEHMMLFSKEPGHPSLRDHALQGKLVGYRAFSVGYDLRALYRKTKTECIFFDIGTHDDVYR